MHYEDSLDSGENLGAEADFTARPAHIPDKFWDGAKRTIRTDALLKAYLDLERRSSARARPAPPESADHYQIGHTHPALASCAEVNRRLFEAGFSQEQAQLVYDLAHDCLLPVLGEEAGKAHEQSQVAHLQDHFGGEGRWRQIAAQLAAWGRKNLPEDAFVALASTADGVKTLHRMMSAGEPSLGKAPAANDEAPSEERLKKMMNDPRYWKARDPAFIAKVSDGFRRLSGG
ncbi:conserved hypothetical protein [Candidatus Terasakiella magnetica]|nr:conserved hypothetical protein [Candidatus Terasakiella magnetica]